MLWLVRCHRLQPIMLIWEHLAAIINPDISRRSRFTAMPPPPSIQISERREFRGRERCCHLFFTMSTEEWRRRRRINPIWTTAFITPWGWCWSTRINFGAKIVQIPPTGLRCNFLLISLPVVYSPPDVFVIHIKTFASSKVDEFTPPRWRASN